MAIVTVLLPNGTKEEANAAREALAKTGWKLVMGTSSAHTPGQQLVGDVVVIGAEPPTLEADVTGKIFKVASLAALAKLDPSKKQKTAKADQAEEPVPDEEVAKLPKDFASSVDKKLYGNTEPEPKPVVSQRDLQAEITKDDEFEDMTRVELIQYASQHWPRERRWVTLKDDALRAAIRELGR